MECEILTQGYGPLIRKKTIRRFAEIDVGGLPAGAEFGGGPRGGGCRSNWESVRGGQSEKGAPCPKKHAGRGVTATVTHGAVRPLSEVEIGQYYEGVGRRVRCGHTMQENLRWAGKNLQGCFTLLRDKLRPSAKTNLGTYQQKFCYGSRFKKTKTQIMERKSRARATGNGVQKI